MTALNRLLAMLTVFGLTMFGLTMFGLILSSCASDPDLSRQVPDLSVPVQLFENSTELSSPDESLRFEFGLDEFDRPRYRAIRVVDGQPLPVLNDSTFGLEAADAALSSGLTIESITDVMAVTDSFDLPTGKARSASITANQRSVTLTSSEAPGITLRIDLWAADDALAFRYRLDGEAGRPVKINIERSSFAFPAGTETWLQPHDSPSIATPAYEMPREKVGSVEEPRGAPSGWTFPALFKTDTSWTLITESALSNGHAGSHLGSTVSNGEYVIALPDPAEGNRVSDPASVGVLPWTSPWRIIMNSADLGDIAESNVVRHLSPPTDPRDFSWVQPGRVSWSWWSDHGSSREPAKLRTFVDLAADIGWEYSLIDANWDSFGDEALSELINHANDRGVGLMLWYNSGGSNNAVTEAPRDRMSESEVRRSEMARISALGIKGIKVDFFQSDKPPTIQQYRDILSDAADHELLVNFHGATVPRGWSREFPNLMTVEAVRGAEIYTFDLGYRRIAPHQNTVLPFTRNVVGSMDYTPLILGDTVIRQTTNGHELALSVVFESGLQHFVDTPEAYLSQPEPVIDLLRTVPSIWDETQLIDGYPGIHAAIARRLGDTWWIGAINGTDLPLTIPLEMGDIAVAGSPATVVCDAQLGNVDDDPDRPDPLPAELLKITSELPASLELPPFGGCLIRLG